MADATTPRSTDPAPGLNRAGRRAEARRLRRAGAALAAVPTALGTTALLLGATALPAGADTLTVTNTAPTGAGSLHDVVEGAADGDVIVFDPSVTGTITLTEEINVAASVTIQGPGAGVLTVDGADTYRLFNVSIGGAASGSFTISGLTLANGSATSAGAVLNANEDLTFDGVVFHSNQATSGNGGAILSDAPDVDLSITSSTFTENTAADIGGAIFFHQGASLTVADSTFTGNTAGEAGGAIKAAYLSPGPVTISGSTFTGNEADSGGAAAIWYSDIDVSVSGSTFTDNDTDDSGGALYLYDLRSVTIAGSTFSLNDSGAEGGAANIYDVGSTTIEGSTFSTNTALDGGGGVYNIYGTTQITNSTFSGNHSTDDYGGALYLGYLDGDAVISSSSFLANTAGDSGGAIEFYYSAGALIVRNSTISGNTAEDSGGGIYFSSTQQGGASMAVYNSTISGNTANGDGGGGISFAGYYGLDLFQTTIAGNTAGTGAGVRIAAWEHFEADAKTADGVGTASGPGGKGRVREAPAPRVGAAEHEPVVSIGSIIAANNGPDVSDQGVLQASSSLLGTIVGTTLEDLGNNLFGVDPLLGPLADNGGPTPTHALLPGSPAINTGPDPVPAFTGNEYDQRGPGYPRVVAGRADIGAFEVQPVTLEPTFTG